MTCDVCGVAPIEGLGGCGLCARCRPLAGLGRPAAARPGAGPAGGGRCDH